MIRLAKTLAVTTALSFVFSAALSQSAQAQTYTVLHNFTNGNDGASPVTGVTVDRGGNLYGTTTAPNYGSIFKLTSQGILSILYTFLGNPGNDGADPEAGLAFGPDGSLYGTTYYGGGTLCRNYVFQIVGCGTAYRLQPPAEVCKSTSCPWLETILNRFNIGVDGTIISSGSLVFDQAGNIYGTTEEGGDRYWGPAYELTPSNGGWAESLVYSFTGHQDGAGPQGVIFDSAGNLYGTTEGYDDAPDDHYGVAFQLVPSGSGWSENVLYTFQNGADGRTPQAPPTLDQQGNLYGSTSSLGTDGAGTVFELSPSGQGWTFNVLYSIPGGISCGPQGALIIDSAGNLYGTTLCAGAHGLGSVFELTYPNWTYVSLHDFDGSDGQNPYGALAFGPNGELYGTTSAGGQNGYGVVFKITQ